jgi:cyclophilin family peptidyl-prolyl cis-trans isomerase
MTIEAGCPLGAEGDPGNGSIGYWLKPELSTSDSGVSHEPGTVGACLATDQEDTAGCRFYITLTRAPFLDGRYTIFGKVTQGLDVARKIFMEPVIEDDTQDEGGNHRPLKPVLIEKVTIHTQVTEAK